MSSYDELMSLDTFEKRFKYLQCNQRVGEDTFGYDRYLNQEFYKSREWQQVRNYVIARDNGCDLGVEGLPINGAIYVHHIIPLTKDDIIHSNDILLDPNNLICTSLETHNAIHYGDDSILNRNNIIERSPNDTSPWLR